MMSHWMMAGDTKEVILLKLQNVHTVLRDKWKKAFYKTISENENDMDRSASEKKSVKILN